MAQQYMMKSSGPYPRGAADSGNSGWSKRHSSARCADAIAGRGFLRGVMTILLLLATPAGESAAAMPNPSPLIGTLQHYRIHASDTFVDLARRFDVGYVALRAANPGVDPWLPGKGTLITVPTAHLLPNAPHRGIVINVGELRAYYFQDRPERVTSYPIGIGREGYDTPLGTTRIVEKRVNPVWIPTASIRRDEPGLPAVVPPGPDNPLGAYALNLGWPDYRIHGTNKPASVGRRVSHGCIHLYPEDIAALFRSVAVGTPVTVVDQPVKLGWVGNDLFIEIHPSLSQIDQIETSGTFEPEAIDGLDRMVWAAADAQIDRVDWALVLKAARERRGVPVRITRPGAMASAGRWLG